MPAGSALCLCTPRAVRAVPRDDHSRGGRSWFACPSHALVSPEAIAGVVEASCLAWLAPCPAWLACLACSIRPTHPAPPSSVSGLTDRGESGSDHRVTVSEPWVLDGAGQCRWPALGIYSVWLPVQHVVCPLGRHDAHRLQGRSLRICCPTHPMHAPLFTSRQSAGSERQSATWCFDNSLCITFASAS